MRINIWIILKDATLSHLGRFLHAKSKIIPRTSSENLCNPNRPFEYSNCSTGWTESKITCVAAPHLHFYIKVFDPSIQIRNRICLMAYQQWFEKNPSDNSRRAGKGCKYNKAWNTWACYRMWALLVSRTPDIIVLYRHVLGKFFLIGSGWRKGKVNLRVNHFNRCPLHLIFRQVLLHKFAYIIDR